MQTPDTKITIEVRGSSWQRLGNLNVKVCIETGFELTTRSAAGRGLMVSQVGIQASRICLHTNDLKFLRVVGILDWLGF